jgi:hypothetical protein
VVPTAHGSLVVTRRVQLKRARCRENGFIEGKNGFNYVSWKRRDIQGQLDLPTHGWDVGLNRGSVSGDLPLLPQRAAVRQRQHVVESLPDAAQGPAILDRDGRGELLGEISRRQHSASRQRCELGGPDPEEFAAGRGPTALRNGCPMIPIHPLAALHHAPREPLRRCYFLDRLDQSVGPPGGVPSLLWRSKSRSTDVGYRQSSLRPAAR